MARTCRVTLTLLAAFALAVWVGLKARDSAKPQPVPSPSAAVPTEDARTLCAERLARLGKALKRYAEDHGGAYPVLPTAAEADTRLLPLLKRFGVTGKDFYCPTEEGPGGRPYVYHCYRARGEGDWPNWMAEKHLVTRKSPPATWLMSDFIARDLPGPHSTTEKAFNVLSADGSVTFHAGRPREVYR